MNQFLGIPTIDPELMKHAGGTISEKMQTIVSANLEYEPIGRTNFEYEYQSSDWQPVGEGLPDLIDDTIDEIEMQERREGWMAWGTERTFDYKDYDPLEELGIASPTFHTYTPVEKQDEYDLVPW